MADLRPEQIVWRTSSMSGHSNCVEVAFSGQAVLVRDSKNRDEGILSSTRSAWKDFLEAIRAGNFS